ncbi:MAG: hypothetical protein Q9221_003359 [Calogaya cf. arnoldii]
MLVKPKVKTPCLYKKRLDTVSLKTRQYAVPSHTFPYLPGRGWTLPAVQNSSEEDVRKDRGDSVAHHFFLDNPDLLQSEFTIQNMTEYVIKTLFICRNRPKWYSIPRKWTINIDLNAIPRELQDPKRVSNGTSPLDRQLLRLRNKDDGYALEATLSSDSPTADRVTECRPRGEKNRATITICRQGNDCSETIVVERWAKPSAATTSVGLQSRKASETAAQLTKATEQQDDGAVGKSKSKSRKRPHGFATREAKRQRISRAQEAAAATPTPTVTANSNANDNEALPASPTNNGGETVDSSEDPSTKLLAEVKAERAKMAEDFKKYQQVSAEDKEKHLLALEETYASMSRMAKTAEANMLAEVKAEQAKITKMRAELETQKAELDQGLATQRELYGEFDSLNKELTTNLKDYMKLGPKLSEQIRIYRAIKAQITIAQEGDGQILTGLEATHRHLSENGFICPHCGALP